MGGHEDDEDDDDDMNEAIEKRLETVDVSEHVDALSKERVTFQKNLRESLQQYLKDQSSLKFVTKLSRLEKEYKTELDESIEETKEELSEKVDTYLNYVVEEWMKENELAVERGLKGEIAEDFISGLKTI